MLGQHENKIQLLYNKNYLVKLNTRQIITNILTSQGPHLPYTGRLTMSSTTDIKYIYREDPDLRQYHTCLGPKHLVCAVSALGFLPTTVVPF